MEITTQKVKSSNYNLFKNIKESMVTTNEHIQYLNREKKLLKKHLMEILLNKKII